MASRFTKLDSLPLSPGHDWVTKSTVGPFVDTTVEIGFAERGRLYLSVATIRELADVAGVLDHYKELATSAWQSGYDQGYKESVSDNYGDRLGSLAADLADLAGVLAVAAGPVVDAADGHLVVDPVDSTIGDDPAALITVGAGGEKSGTPRKR